MTKFVSENIYFDLVGGWSTTEVHGDMKTRLACNPSGVAVAQSIIPLPFDFNTANKLLVLLSKQNKKLLVLKIKIKFVKLSLLSLYIA